MPNQMIIDWVDEDGDKARSRLWTNLNDPVGLADVIDALAAVSEAALVRYGILTSTEPAVAIAAGSGPYDIADKVELVFRTSNGQKAKFTFPAPTSGILPDSDNVNILDAGVVALSDAIKQAVRTPGGETLDELLSGRRIRSSRSV